MIRTGLSLGLLVLAFAGACGGSAEGEEAVSKACGPAPAAMSGEPRLPAGFPTPEGVTYTGEEQAGPSTIVGGYREGGIEDAFEAYKDAFEEVDYEVTQEEREEVDAEVNFAGGGADGQVKLLHECQDRTSVSITIRPA